MEEVAPGAGDSTRVVQLLAEARQNKDGAWRELDDAIRPRLVGFVEWLGDRQGSPDWDAADVVQECLTILFEKRETIWARSDAELWAFLQKTARNLYLLRVRYDGREKRREDRRQPLPQDSHSGVPLPADTSSPSQRAMRHEAEDILADVLARLPEKDQHLVRLRCFEKRPWEEIAQQLGCKVAAVQRQYHRTIERLRKMMGDEP